MKSLAHSLALALLASFALTPLAGAQWISFTDETGTRLTLQPFADNPGGNPLFDDEEKDVAVGDLDKDGAEDIIVVRKEPFSNAGARQDVLLMNENGVLVDRTALYAPEFLTALTDARDVFIGDFTGDQWPDVVIANTFGQQPSFYRNLGEDAGNNWLGLVDESGTRLPTINTPGDARTVLFCAVWGGDINGDNALDIYLSNYDPTAIGTNDILFVNDGAGFFTNETPTRLGNYANVAFGTGAEIRDVDNDGDNDIIKISTLYSEPPFNIGQFILFNDGTGDFDNIPFQTMPSNAPYMFAAGDLNGDNLLDFLMQGDNQDRVAIASSAVPDTVVNFNASNLSPSPRTGGFGGNTKLADLDGDGDLDGAIGPIDTDIQNCGGSSEIALLENPGNGLLFDPWSGANDQNFHVDPHDFGFLDLNGDGCLDVFMGKCTGWQVFVQAECSAAPQVAGLIRHRTSFGTETSGNLGSLGSSDDSYLTIDAEATPTGHRAVLNTWSDSPLATVSSLGLTLELGVSAAPARVSVRLNNVATGQLDTIARFVGPLNDTVKLYPSIANPNDYISPGSGFVQLKIEASSLSGQLPAGFELRVDQILFEVMP